MFTMSTRIRYWSMMWDIGGWISTSTTHNWGAYTAKANTPIYKYLVRNITDLMHYGDMRVYARQHYTLMKAILCRMRVSRLLKQLDWEKLREQSALKSRKRTRKRTRKGKSKKMGS